MVTCIMHYIDGDFKHLITTNGNYFLLLVTEELLEEANALLLKILLGMHAEASVGFIMKNVSYF
jgi:hypothetical protein